MLYYKRESIYYKKTYITWLLIFLVTFTISLNLTGCAEKTSTTEINIAEQYGIAYAPLQIMKAQKILEQALPGVKINWKQYGGPTPIREGMLAGEVDFAFMGAAPVLIGIDNGMNWKYATGISSNQVALVTDNPEINSLKDFSETDKIAVLSPGATQHILLCIASNQVFGDPDKFDNQIVSLSHPDSMDALIADTEVVAHFSTPPYLDKELQHGMKIILTGEEIIGQPFTFITGVALDSFYNERPEEYMAIIKSLNKAIDYINCNIDDAVSTLAPIYGIDEKTLKEQMTYNGTIYSNQLNGIDRLADEMYKIGIIKNQIIYDDIIFPNVRGDNETE